MDRKLIAAALVAGGLLCTGCAGPRAGVRGQPDIAAVKSGEWRAFVGRTVTLTGFLVTRPAPMLVTSMALLEVNAPVPEAQYIRLSGPGVAALADARYYGAQVRVTGVVRTASDSLAARMTRRFGDAWAVELVVPSAPEIIRKAAFAAPVTWVCRVYPQLCVHPPRPLAHRYAILVSGGINRWNAYARYWNDLKFAYATLINRYGFTAADIVVAYKDGTAEDADMVVDFAADSAGVDSAFAYVRARITSLDFFVFVSTNHGGGYLMNGATTRLAGGRVDASGDETDAAIFESHVGTDLNGDGDQTDQVRYDVVTYLYDSPRDLWDDDLATYLDGLRYRSMLVVLGQCFSGGNLADLRGRDRVIISAASEWEFSYGEQPVGYDTFLYHFIAALNGATPDGTAVTADADTDGKVSVVEAFEYARRHDTRPETPWYEDSGDGRGHAGPLPQGGDGSFGSHFTL